MTSLRALVEAGELKAPVQRGYSKSAWDSALRALASPTPHDQRLHRTAVFFGIQLEALRSTLAAAPPVAGSVEAQVRRAVGLVNREYLTVVQRVQELPVPDNRWITDVVQAELDLAGGINSATPDDVIETVVDALRFELGALWGGGSASASTLRPLEQIQRVGLRGNLSVYYGVLEDQWLNCLHHGWDVRVLSGPSLIFPSDRGSAVSWAVGQYGEAVLGMELITRAAHYLQERARYSAQPLRHGVMRTASGKHKRYAVEPMSRQLSDELTACRMVAAEPDLEPFALSPLPRVRGTTALQILEVWTALIALAEETAARSPTGDKIKNVNQLERFAPLEELQPVLLALSKCTGLPLNQCAAAMDQLTWRTVRDSLWSRPIVKFRNGSHFAMVLPALRSANLRRSIEYWLSDGGIDLGDRGDPFEQFIRDDAADAITANAALAGQGGALRGKAQPRDLAVGDIDLLLWIDRTVLVGETKCMLRPGTPYERRQYEDRIRDGAGQALKKAAYVKAHPEWLAEQDRRLVSVAAEPFAVVPCVVINSAVGALRSVDDVPIIDRYILNRYLLGFAETRNSLARDSATKVAFYSDAGEAGRQLAAYLKRPGHLNHYLDSTKWSTRVQPNFMRTDQVVITAFPTVQISPPGVDEDAARGDPSKS